MNRAVCALLAVLGLMFAAARVSATEAESQSPVVVMVDRKPAGLVYTLNSRVPPEGLLLALSNMNAKGGRAHSGAVLLAHEATPLTTINNVLGIMAKAGYSEPRVFYFDEGKNWMSEITFSKSTPFSASGSPPQTRQEQKGK